MNVPVEDNGNRDESVCLVEIGVDEGMNEAKLSWDIVMEEISKYRQH